MGLSIQQYHQHLLSQLRLSDQSGPDSFIWLIIEKIYGGLDADKSLDLYQKYFQTNLNV